MRHRSWPAHPHQVRYAYSRMGELSGYHRVWPRDCYATSLHCVASGSNVRRLLLTYSFLLLTFIVVKVMCLLETVTLSLIQPEPDI